MEKTAIICENFMEFYNFVKPLISSETPKIAEFCQAVEDISIDCECNRTSNINRAINRYVKISSISPEELKKLKENTNNLPVILIYQNEVFASL